MKLTRTLRVGVLAVAFGSLVYANAADFSKKSDKELKESGLPPHRHFKDCKAECKDKKHCEPKKK